MTEDGRGRSEGSKRTQFPSGVSGNKGGRPRGAKGFRSELKEELDELVEVTEGGKVRRLPKRRLILKSLVTKAAKGDVRAAERIVALIKELEGFDDPNTDRKKLSENDQHILDYYLGIAQEPLRPPTSAGTEDHGEQPDLTTARPVDDQ